MSTVDLDVSPVRHTEEVAKLQQVPMSRQIDDAPTGTHLSRPANGLRQDHDRMWVGSMHPTRGPGRPDYHHAASGGSEVVGAAAHAFIVPTATAPRESFPGERERDTLTYPLPGAFGGRADGSADLPGGASSMDATTIAEHQKEGGGASSQRRPRADGTRR